MPKKLEFYDVPNVDGYTGVGTVIGDKIVIVLPFGGEEKSARRAIKYISKGRREKKPGYFDELIRR